MVTICTASLTFSNSTFCPHSLCMCFVLISEQTAFISLYSINWLLFVTETQCVYCAVRTGSLYCWPFMSFQYRLMHNPLWRLLPLRPSASRYSLYAITSLNPQFCILVSKIFVVLRSSNSEVERSFEQCCILATKLCNCCYVVGSLLLAYIMWQKRTVL